MSARSPGLACLLAASVVPLGLSTAAAMDDPAVSIENNLRNPVTVSVKEAPVKPEALYNAANTPIENNLRNPVSVNVREAPAKQLLEAWCDAANIPVVVDYVALDKEDIDLMKPISLNLEKLRLKSVLSLVLDSVGATYRVEGGVLRVTTRAALEDATIVLKAN